MCVNNRPDSYRGVLPSKDMQLGKAICEVCLRGHAQLGLLLHVIGCFLMISAV